MVGSVRRHHARDRGAQTVQYGALLLLIAAVLTALGSVGVPRMVSGGVERAICTIFAIGDCTRPVAEPPAGDSGRGGSGSDPGGSATPPGGDGRVGGAAAPAAAPPNIPSASTAAGRLAELTVAPESHSDTYDRAEFPHWITISGACNAREEVLKRDGTGVTVGSDCAPTSGTWRSPYDGATWTDPSGVDIDHMVPLKEAWESGAWNWTTPQRQTYANDLDGPQLWAVTDNVNQSKSDQDPTTWQPPLSGFHCTYARAWIQVKWTHDLSVDNAEKSALTSMLDTC